MIKDKHEYLLKVWGGFYNEEFKKIHGKEGGEFFFDSMDDLKSELASLESIRLTLNTDTVLMHDISEGKFVRYKTIAKMKFKYNGKLYDYEEDFGYGYPPESARFMFEDGNYACDCNRLLFLDRTYNLGIEEVNCGNQIEMLDLKIHQVKK